MLGSPYLWKLPYKGMEDVELPMIRGSLWAYHTK